MVKSLFWISIVAMIWVKHSYISFVKSVVAFLTHNVSLLLYWLRMGRVWIWQNIVMDKFLCI
ncbi:unnamed protein product [Meloidogyne enterolobii]|uniref:Uncharacterized protein n=1 Tax=Meloidogyne enterolobii TaxID=390850 RepID=A0ACB0YRX2_MELEN